MTYTEYEWKNKGEGENTPLDKTHLNHLEAGIKGEEERALAAEEGKADLEEGVLKADQVPASAISGSGVYTVVPPSGDETGGTDLENINAALKNHSPGTVWLAGDYWIDGPIEIPSNQTLLLVDASITSKSAGGCWNVIRNANLAEGNEHIRVLGIGRATLIGNGTLNKWEPEGGGWEHIAHLFVKVKHLELAGLQYQASKDWNLSLQNCAYGDIHDLTFLGVPNGMQCMGGNHDIVVSRLRGRTVQPAVVFEATDELGSDAKYCYDGSGNGDIFDVTVRDVQVASETSQLVWFAGAKGSKIGRVLIEECREAFSDEGEDPKKTKGGTIQLGANAYEHEAPLYSEMNDVVVRRCNAETIIQQSCSNILVEDSYQPHWGDFATEAPLHEEGGGFSCFVKVEGSAEKPVVVYGLIIKGGGASKNYTATGAILTTTAHTTLEYVAISGVNVPYQTVHAILANEGIVTNLHLADLYFERLVTFSASTVQETGTARNVLVDKWAEATKYATKLKLAFGGDMPVCTEHDVSPEPIAGSIVRCDATKVLDGGEAKAALYVAGGTKWTRIASIE